MPIIERDPWRVQYFEQVSCPEDVIIPTDDEHAYELYPEFRWIYNKLLICDTQGIAGAPHGVPRSCSCLTRNSKPRSTARSRRCRWR